tara:strand:+ start:112 stop:339 length:228 start_codon:yes stop_codon:yes gene_type:complete
MLRALIHQTKFREAICIPTEKRNRKKIPFCFNILSKSALDSLEQHCRKQNAARAVRDYRRVALQSCFAHNSNVAL